MRCHDWRSANFPVALVGDLRQLYRALAKLRPHLTTTGAALAKLQATWPAGGADTVACFALALHAGPADLKTV